MAINVGGLLCEISKTRTFITKKTMMDFVFCISLHIVQIVYNNIVNIINAYIYNIIYIIYIYIYTNEHNQIFICLCFAPTEWLRFHESFRMPLPLPRGFLILVGSDMGMSYFQLVLHLSGVIGLLSLLELPALFVENCPHLTSN